MKVSITGTGHIGLPIGVCLAEVGHHVVSIDIDPNKVEMINQGLPPIFEEGLESKLKKALNRGRFECTTDFDKIKGTEITFITVSTPSNVDGRMNLKYVEEATKSIGQVLKAKDGYHVVVLKSTVIPGATKEIIIPILERYSAKSVPEDIGVCMNPEFMREGKAISDFLNMNRVIIGEVKGDRRAGDKLIELFESFSIKNMIMRIGLTEAEMIKFANNAFLATRVSFANEIGNICNALGINGHIVMEALTLDPRFGKSHLKPGPAYGGSCLPKDVKGLIAKAKDIGYEPKLLESVEVVNEEQKEKIVRLCEKVLGKLENKKISVLGLTFKTGTNDIRDSHAIDIIHRLIAKNAEVVVHDPVALEDAKIVFEDKVAYAENPLDALKGSHCCIIATDWDIYKNLDREFEHMAQKNVIDTRKVIEKMKAKDLKLNLIVA